MKILLIDDDENIQSLFKYNFKKEIRDGSLTFYFAFSAFEALNLFVEEGLSDISLVISDISMPGMTGFELLKIIKRKIPDIKFFIISGYGRKKNELQAIKNGADVFFSKPLDFNKLKDEIMNISGS